MRTPMLPDNYQHHQEQARRSLLTRKPGRMWERASLICAAWSVFIAPAVFGPVGVAAGTVAVAKGDKWWGMAGVSGSAVAAVVGFYWAGGLMTEEAASRPVVSPWAILPKNLFVQEPPNFF